MTKLFLDGSRSGNMVPAPIKSSSFFRPEKTGKKISAAGTSIVPMPVVFGTFAAKKLDSCKGWISSTTGCGVLAKFEVIVISMF